MQTKASNASAPLASLDLTSFHISAPGLCRHICQYIILQNLTFVRPWWHNLSHFSHGLNTCFIHGSNRQGMDGTLGVAPRQAYDTKFASWLVSQQFAATTLRRLRGGPWKEGPFRARKLRATVRFCAYFLPIIFALATFDYQRLWLKQCHFYPWLGVKIYPLAI